MYRKTNKLGSKIVEGQSQLLVTTTEHKTTHSRQAAPIAAVFDRAHPLGPRHQIRVLGLAT